MVCVYQTPKVSKIIGDVPDFLDKSGFSFAERRKEMSAAEHFEQIKNFVLSGRVSNFMPRNAQYLEPDSLWAAELPANL